MLALLSRMRALQSLVDTITSSVWQHLGTEQIKQCANYEEWFPTSMKKKCTLHLKLNTIGNLLKSLERHHMDMVSLWFGLVSLLVRCRRATHEICGELPPNAAQGSHSAASMGRG